MAKSTFDFSKFKKVESNDDYSVLKNDDGHEIKIAHNTLSKQFKRDLGKLPLYLADGGLVPEQPVAAENEEVMVTPEEIVGTSQDVVMEENPGVIELNPQIPADLPEVSMDDLRQSFPDADDEMLMSIMQAAGGGSTQSIPEDVMMTSQVPEAAQTPTESPSQTTSGEGMLPSERQVAADMPNVISPGDLQLAGRQAETEAEASLGQAQANIIDRTVAAQERARNRFSREMQDIEAENDKLMKDIQDSKIDPSRYMGNMSTGAKIATAIGIVMGGVGGALTGTENAALKVVNQQIQDDIKAQQANLGKKETLLSANMKRYRDLRDAYDATAIQMGRIAEMQLKSATARAGSDLAKARGMQALGEIQGTLQEQERKLAVRRMAANLMSGGGGSSGGDGTGMLASRGQGMNPQDLPAILSAVYEMDPEQGKLLQERFVPGLGIATTKEDAKHLKQLNATVKNVSTGVEQLMTLADKSLENFSPTDRAEAKTIASMMIGELRLPIVGPGAVSEKELELLNDIVANPTEMTRLDSTAKASLKKLQSRLRDKLDADSAARGIQGARENSLTPQQRSFLNWAKANPDDPRSADVLKKLGME